MNSNSNWGPRGLTHGLVGVPTSHTITGVWIVPRLYELVTLALVQGEEGGEGVHFCNGSWMELESK